MFYRVNVVQMNNVASIIVHVKMVQFVKIDGIYAFVDVPMDVMEVYVRYMIIVEWSACGFIYRTTLTIVLDINVQQMVLVLMVLSHIRVHAILDIRENIVR
jgi:hypothetical protein